MTSLETIVRNAVSKIPSSVKKNSYLNPYIKRGSQLAASQTLPLHMTPLGSVARGIAAGLIGTGAIHAFMGLTKPYAPEEPKDTSFDAPEEKQAKEEPTETTARRFVEGMMQRGPLSKKQKQILGELVSFGFGARWGALYSLARDSYPAIGGPLGVAGFSTAVWAVSDGGILPLFKLAPAPQEVPLANHLYQAASHLVYGAAVAGADELLARSKVARVSAVGLGALGVGLSIYRLWNAPAKKLKKAVKSKTRETISSRA